MNSLYRNLISIAIAILPVNIWMIWYRLNQTENFSTIDMTVYPLVVGGGISILILALNKYFLNQNFSTTFNHKNSNWLKDVGVGIALTVIYFILFFIERQTLYQWIPRTSPPNTEIIDVLRDLANNPLLLILWFGPVLWIGIALFEELSRVFFLTCLWNLKKDKSWEIFSILIVSTLIGFAHIYQGTAGIISIGIKSVVACAYFYKYRRILPLIISHGLYDGLQFMFFVLQFQN